MSSAPVRPQNRFTRNRPCPICGGYDGAARGAGVRCYGFNSDGGDLAFCTRESHAGNLAPRGESDAYLHRLAGPCACGTEHGIAIVWPSNSNGHKNRRHSSEKPTGRIECYHVYYDESGRPLHRTVRWCDPKEFRQQHYENGRWRTGLGDVPRVLYHLPHLLSADPAIPVFLVEGERDADRLGDLGYLATTNPLGARKWQPQYTAWLRERDVVILEDNDEDGAHHTERLIRELAGAAARLRVVTFPDLEIGGDVADWLDAGHSGSELLRRAHDVLVEASA